MTPWRRFAYGLAARQNLPLVAVAALLAAAVWMPPITLQRATFQYMVTFDVTQSMEVDDQSLGGGAATRLAFARAAAREALRRMPCGSKVGWAGLCRLPGDCRCCCRSRCASTTTHCSPRSTRSTDACAGRTRATSARARPGSCGRRRASARRCASSSSPTARSRHRCATRTLRRPCRTSPRATSAAG